MDIKRITFRVDYYCTLAFINNIVESITDVFDFEIMYRRLTDLDMQYCEINSVADNLGMDKYNLINIDKDESYIFYHKPEEYSMTVFVNKYFVACVFDINKHNDSVIEEILDIASTIENAINENKKKSFAAKTCWSIKHRQCSLKDICNLEFNIQDIDNFEKVEYSQIKYVDEIKLEKKRILFSAPDVVLNLKDYETEKIKKFDYVVKSYATSDNNDDNWKRLFEKVEKMNI